MKSQALERPHQGLERPLHSRLKRGGGRLAWSDRSQAGATTPFSCPTLADFQRSLERPLPKLERPLQIWSDRSKFGASAPTHSAPWDFELCPVWSDRSEFGATSPGLRRNIHFEVWAFILLHLMGGINTQMM